MDIDALADQVAGVKIGCWRTRLQGDALELAELVEDRTPNPSRTLMHRALDQVGVSISRRAIGAHYAGECSCPR